MNREQFLDKIRANHPAFEHNALAMVVEAFPRLKGRENFSQGDVRRFGAFVKKFGAPEWARAALFYRESPLPPVLGQNRAENYSKHARILRKLASLDGKRIGEGHVLAARHVGFDAPFEIRIAQVGKLTRVKMPFDIQLLGGKPHFVLYTVQGKFGPAEVTRDLPPEIQASGKDWRTQAVLYMEQLCSENGIPFAAIAPKHNYEVMDPHAATNEEKEMLRHRISSYLNKTYRQAGLRKVVRGNYYAREEP